MKVFVCWTIPEYIGIDIEAIFDNEDDAKRFVEDYNSSHPSYDRCSYDEYEVNSYDKLVKR